MKTLASFYKTFFNYPFIIILWGVILLLSDHASAGNIEECREIWTTPHEIQSCVLLKGVEEKSRYQEVLKKPTKPHGYRSFIFSKFRELLKDGQTHLFLSVELIVTHGAFQYLTIRDITAERLIKKCMRIANPQEPSSGNIKSCILNQLRLFFKQNYKWKQEPLWAVGLQDFQIQLQKRESLRSQ